MKTRGWVIVEPGGIPLWWTADCLRANNQALAQSWIDDGPWKQLYRQGYRCVPCEVKK